MAVERDDESGPTAVEPTAIAPTIAVDRPIHDESGPTVLGPNAPAPSHTVEQHGPSVSARTVLERPSRPTAPPPAAISARPLAERTDSQLLEGWRAGDAAAGEALVARHWTSVSRFFRSKIGDDGADLISQTFLACVEARDRIESDNIKAYLFSVARRRLADFFRSRARTPTIDFSVSSVIDLGTGPVTHLARRERGEILRDALARLPLDDQIALELAYFEALSMREIAGILEIAENTVRSRLSRAREKLRVALRTTATPAEAALAESTLPTE